MKSGLTVNSSYSEKYGVTSEDCYWSKNILINEHFAQILNRVTIQCPLCHQQFITQIKGDAFDKTLQGKCSNRHCLNFNLPEKFKISYYWPNNLTAVCRGRLYGLFFLVHTRNHFFMPFIILATAKKNYKKI